MPKGIYTRTEYHRKISSEGHKGQRPWNKGKKCPQCGMRGKDNPQYGLKHSNKYRKAMSERLKGDKHYNWKGGKKIDKCGYILIYMPKHPFARNDISHGKRYKRYILEHRVIIEQQIKRYLKSTEYVHHINKNKSDNRPENLMAFKTKRSHERFERNCPINKNDIIFDGRLLLK